MNKIKFTTGKIEMIGQDFYKLTLYNNDKVVYKVNVNQKESLALVENYNGKISIT